MPAAFLPPDASTADRWHALRLNAESCYERCALAQPGQGQQQSKRLGDVLLTKDHAVIPSRASLNDDAQIDEMLHWYRTVPVAGAGILWYLNEARPPPELGARLLARGVSPNWEPHWMWFELGNASDLPPLPPPSDVAVDIHTVQRGETYTPPREEEDAYIQVLLRQEPRVCWHIVALVDGKRVGACFVNSTAGEYGVAGLYDMWVDESLQRKGIGSALVRASIVLAKELGHNHMYLNSTPAGEVMYQKGGFTSIARSTTWHIRGGFKETKPPDEAVVRFLEALLLGKVALLDELAAGLTTQQLQAPTINTATPLEMAVQMEQLASAEWLVNHGVVPDVMSLWELGWKDRLRDLLREHPEEVNRKHGDCNETPLHKAVARDDVELAQMLLDAPNIDLSVTDDVYHGTPMRWATVLGAEKVMPLLSGRE